MTVIKFTGRDDVAEGVEGDILNIARRAFDELLLDLEAYRARLTTEAGPFPGAEMRKTLVDIRFTIRSLLNERSKIDEVRKRDAGVGHGYAIDFDAARDEIGRRLDRLRAARDTDGLS